MGESKRKLPTFRDIWLSLTLKQKIRTFAGATMLIVLMSTAFNLVIVNFSLYGFKTVLDDNGRSYDFMESIETESRAFEAYNRNRTAENEETYELACMKTRRSIEMLPYDYHMIGSNRYAKTWSIRNSYEFYEEQRRRVLGMDVEDGEYITELYKTYDMQGHIGSYARSLVQTTLREGNQVYQDKVRALYTLPVLIMVVGVVLMGLSVYLTMMVNRTLISPVIKLAHVSRKIAKNDFSGEDVEVPNRDEMGELVHAFNRMKHATVSYIAALEEKREMAELLHKEELEKMEIEKRLDATNLELLKSQINPHFLFNTLNMIGCMAKLEDAGTTEQMTVAMSSLFRYNLKTPDAVVVLEQELKVARDYMYLQQMRFGSRIQYDVTCNVDAKSVMVPTFTFQPIVENAIIHGLSKQEEGGRIRIRIWEEEKKVVITIADTGVGMPPEVLSDLRSALVGHVTAKAGIGVGNIYKRIQAMYKDGEFQIYSRKGCGTVVRMAIPQE